MSIIVQNSTPITIQITSPTITTLTLFPNETFTGSNAGGDLTGTYPNPTVHKLHGHDVANTTPTTSNILAWRSDGTSFKWRPSTTTQAGVAALTHKHFLASDLLDVALDYYEDPYTSTCPLLFFDANTDNFSLIAGDNTGSDVNHTIINGEIYATFQNRLGTIPRVKALAGTYELNTVMATTLSAQQLVSQRVYITPLMPNFDYTCSHLVTAIASGGADYEMALYESDPATGWIVGAPVYTTGTITGSVTGVREIAVIGTTFFNINKNLQYWIALKTNNGAAITPRTANTGSVVPLYTPLTSNGTAGSLFYLDTVFGTWRNFTTSPVTTSDLSTGNAIPIMGVKVT